MGDLQFLRRQLVSRARIAPPRRSSARPQLDAGALDPERCSESLERIECQLEVLACLDAVAGAPEELPEGKLGTGALEGTRRLGIDRDRLAEAALGVRLVVSEKRPTMEGDRSGPGNLEALGPRLEPKPASRGPALARRP